MGKVALKPLKDSSPFRKIALGTWNKGGDPSVYGSITIDMTKCLPLIEEWNKTHDFKITPLHLVGRAIAHTLKVRPDLNGMIRAGKIYLREQVNLFFQVNIPGGRGKEIEQATLSGTTIEAACSKNVLTIAQELALKAKAVRAGTDQELAKNLALFKWLPWSLARAYLTIGSWLIYGLNLDLSFIGLPRDPFGSVMITNVGGLGIDRAWAPLVPYSRVPLVLSVGKVELRPWVVDGKVEARPLLEVGVTFDHRLIDGVHAAHMAQLFKQCFLEPEMLLKT